MQKLVISDDEGQTTVVPLVRDELSIGREPGNTIRLTERNVSRRHARLSRNGGGRVVIEDLGSYNGVFVNGRPIEGAQPLAPGDAVRIGDYQILLRDETAEDPLASPHRRTTANHRARGPVREPSEPAPPPARLILLSPPAPGAEFALTGSLLRIGRQEELDIWINHKSISRVHAELDLGAGQYVLRDAGSANGLRVNGRRVERASLAPGDVIDIGQVRLRFVAPGEDYRFDLDRTVELARPLGRRRRGPRPAVAVAVVLCAAAVALLVGVTVQGLRRRGTATAPEPIAVPAREVRGGAPAPELPPGTPPGDEASVVVAPGATVPPVPTGGPDAEAMGSTGEGAPTHLDEAAPPGTAASRRCEEALAEERWEEALAVSGSSEDGSPLAACRRLAALRRTEAGIFDRAVALFEGGDVAGAHFALAGLSDDSPFRARDPAPAVDAAYAELAYERASSLASTRPAAARDVLDELLAMEGLSSGLRRRVARLSRRLRSSAPRPATPGAEGADGLR